MRHLTCRNCKCQSISFAGSRGDPINVGEVAKEVNFKCVFSDDGTIWLCSTCFNKAQDLAKQIMAILHDDSVKLCNLLPL